MKIPFFLLILATLIAEEAPKQAMPAVSSTATNDKSIMVVDPKTRANDYVQAFDVLKRDKPTLKMMVRTTGTIYQNVTELTAASGGTLLYLKVLSNQGTKIQIIPVEELMEIAYSP